MKMEKTDFLTLVTLAFDKEAIKRIVFSRPKSTEVTKVSGRLSVRRDHTILALEYSLPGNTVSHKNLNRSELSQALTELIAEYRQVNLITALGDAEYKLSKDGTPITLGADKLYRKLCDTEIGFENTIEALDKKKNYILSGSEDFLVTLEVSDKSGRVHDKKQAKFRQINKFLEHIESIYKALPESTSLTVYDLCCGKSYLSFAVYYYLTEVKKREVKLLGIDLKRDVIRWCNDVASSLGYTGMTFVCDNVTNTPKNERPDMVISLHACDIATDIVIDTAISLDAGVILSTPCCHRYLNDRVANPALKFVTEHGHLRNKLCDALTDSLRTLRLKANGYSADALELTDPEDTPKNTLILATKKQNQNPDTIKKYKEQYEEALYFIMGCDAKDYLKEIKNI